MRNSFRIPKQVWFSIRSVGAEDCVEILRSVQHSHDFHLGCPRAVENHVVGETTNSERAKVGQKRMAESPQSPKFGSLGKVRKSREGRLQNLIGCAWIISGDAGMDFVEVTPCFGRKTEPAHAGRRALARTLSSFSAASPEIPSPWSSWRTPARSFSSNSALVETTKRPGLWVSSLPIEVRRATGLSLSVMTISLSAESDPTNSARRCWASPSVTVDLRKHSHILPAPTSRGFSQATELFP